MNQTDQWRDDDPEKETSETPKTEGEVKSAPSKTPKKKVVSGISKPFNLRCSRTALSFKISAK